MVPFNKAHTELHSNRNSGRKGRNLGRGWKTHNAQTAAIAMTSRIQCKNSIPLASTNKKARKGHFLLVEKGRKEATSKNAEEGVGSNPGVRWKEGHPENRSQGAKPAKAAPKASLTAGCSHRFHQNLGRRGKIPAAGK